MVAPIEIYERSAKNQEILIVSTSGKVNSWKSLLNKLKYFQNKINDVKDVNNTLNKPKQINKVPKRYFWSGGMGIVLALLNSCLIFCAWPQHHLYLVPKAWHEFMTTTAIGFIGLFAASMILNSEIWLDLKTIKTWKNFVVLYLISVLAWFLANIGYYHIYCVMLNLSPPMPLNIHVCSVITLVFSLSFFWFLIPSPLRTLENKKSFLKRYGYYVLAQIFRYFAVLEYLVVAWLFVTVDIDYQWTIAIVLPIMREMNGWILTRICYNSAGSRVTTSK